MVELDPLSVYPAISERNGNLVDSNCGFRRLSLLISVRHARVGLLGVAAPLIPLRKIRGFFRAELRVLKMSHSTSARRNLIKRFVDN